MNYLYWDGNDGMPAGRSDERIDTLNQGVDRMSSKTLIGGTIAFLVITLVAFSGVLTAGSGGTCTRGAGAKVEGKSCANANSEACQAMKAHHEKLQAAVAEMGQHLADMETIGEDREWMQEMQQHLVLLQGVLDEIANAPMGGMMHPMMGGHAEMGSGGK